MAIGRMVCTLCDHYLAPTLQRDEGVHLQTFATAQADKAPYAYDSVSIYIIPWQYQCRPSFAQLHMHVAD